MCIGAELEPLTKIEFIHPPHQSDITLLDQVHHVHATAKVFLGNTDDQPQVGFRKVGLGSGAFFFDMVEVALELGVHLR